MRGCALLLALLVFAGLAVPVGAQLAAPNEVGVAMGHLHYYVRDLDANQRFWESLGGEVSRFGESMILAFPGVLGFLTEGDPEGGTEGSILNHVAFRVQSLETLFRERLARLESLPVVDEVRGIGGLAVAELHPEKQSGYLDARGPRMALAFLQRGILLRPLGNVLYFLPPYAITDEQAHGVFDQIEEVLNHE